MTEATHGASTPETTDDPRIDEAIDESFPASDPPAWTGGIEPPPADHHGVVDVRSRHSVTETLQRLESGITSAGLTLFARIDFSGDARRAGLIMHPMQMVLFGNPKGGTPLLVAAPRAGLDLPLKALVWEDPGGQVWVSSNAPEYIVKRHGAPDGLAAPLAGAAALVRAAAD